MLKYMSVIRKVKLTTAIGKNAPTVNIRIAVIVSVLYGYAIVSSSQKNPRRKGFITAFAMRNGTATEKKKK